LGGRGQSVRAKRKNLGNEGRKVSSKISLPGGRKCAQETGKKKQASAGGVEKPLWVENENWEMGRGRKHRLLCTLLVKRVREAGDTCF